MNTGLKVLLFGVGTLITALFAILLFMTAKEGRQVGFAATTQMSELNEDIKNSGILKYEDMDIYGSEVVNCMRENLGDYTSAETAPIYVRVETTASTNTYTNGSILNEVRDFTKQRYIKPTAVFRGDIIKNTNDVIIGLNFIQQ